MIATALFFILIFSLSSVQTEFAQRITKNVNNRFDTDISINKASISLNGDVLISNILVKDHHKDTLLFVQELKTSLNSLDRFSKTDYDFESINLDGVKLFLTQYAGESKSSLQYFIFKLKDTTGIEPKPFTFKAQIIDLKSTEVISEDYNIKDSKLIFSEIGLGIKDLNFNSKELDLSIQYLKGISNQYGRINDFQTNIHYSSDSLVSKDFFVKVNQNEIKGSGLIAFNGGNLSNLNPAFFQIKLDEVNVNPSKINGLQPYFNESFLFDAELQLQGKLSDFYLTSTVNLGVESFMKGSIRLINAFESEKFNAESNDFIIKTSDKALKSLMNKSFYNKFSKYTAQTGDLFLENFFFRE